MQTPICMKDTIYWIGVNDRETHLFENLWPLENGVSYNSYVINGEKTALIDTVKANKADDYLYKIKEVIGNKPIDYLIVNHMEPDHSGLLTEIIKSNPNITVVGNKNTQKFIKQFYQIEPNFMTVTDGDSIDLGSTTLKFYHTPMVHWPETIMTFDEKNGVLFSGDAFGGFGSLDGGIFDDEVNLEFFKNEIRRYFSSIVGKYSPMVQNAIKKLNNIGIQPKLIAPTHGVIWRENPSYIIDLYDKWSRYEVENGAVIVYGSMYGNTARMADTIARSLSTFGIRDIRVYDASRTHYSHMINDIWRYKACIIGSCTYNQGLFPPVLGLMEKLEDRKIKNHIFGVFGTYTWSGGGVKTILEYIEKNKWELVHDPIEAQCSPGESEYERCLSLAETVANLLKD
jgi:flavorubredoxin